MKKMMLVPDGFACSIEECPPGPFAYGTGIEYSLGFKSEYKTKQGKIEAYCESGEFYCGEDKVIPLVVRWEEN